MTIQSTDKNDGNSFEYRLREVTDEEIINILRFREHYQPHAVREAIKEAIKRGIINSIDDLENEEFKPLPLPSKSLFPISRNEYQNTSVFKSLCRIVYIIALIPIIYGIIQITVHNNNSAVITVLVGISIVFLTIKLEKEKKTIYSFILLFLNVLTIGTVIFYLLSMNNPSTMDIFTAVVIIVVFLYSTIYLHKLNLYFNKNYKL